MMKIIYDYLLDEDANPGYLTVLSNVEHICNVCNHPMKCKDRRKRIGRSYNGHKSYYLIRRMYCYTCHVMHNELPDSLLFKKHYEAQVVEDIIDGVISEEDGLDYPSEMTMKRWRIWFK